MPVPRRADAVVQRARGDRALPLLRLRPSGDVFTFVQEIEHLDFVGAVEKLAAKAGIQLRYTRAARDGAAAPQAARRGDGQGGRLVPRAPADGPDAREARDYLRRRGLAGDVARPFRLGWAPDDWDQLSRASASPPSCCARPAWRSPTGATACRTRSGPG